MQSGSRPSCTARPRAAAIDARVGSRRTTSDQSVRVEFLAGRSTFVRKDSRRHGNLSMESRHMEYTIKHISIAGIAEAVSKAELYRSLNEPEEAESICRDILDIEQHQLALRLLGLALT